MALWYTVAPSSQKKGKRRKSTSTLNLSDQSTHPSTSAITNFIQRYKLPQILYCRYFCHLSNGLRIEKLCCSHVWYILFWKDVLSFFHVSLHLCMGLYSWIFLSKYRDFESKRLFNSIFLVSIHCQTRCWLTVCWGCSEHAHCRKLVYAFNSVWFTLRGVETWTVQTALRMLARCVVRIDKRSCFFVMALHMLCLSEWVTQHLYSFCIELHHTKNLWIYEICFNFYCESVQHFLFFIYLLLCWWLTPVIWLYIYSNILLNWFCCCCFALLGSHSLASRWQQVWLHCDGWKRRLVWNFVREHKRSFTQVHSWSPEEAWYD